MEDLKDEKDKPAYACECTSCGKTNEISDGFCANCGAKNEAKWVCKDCGQANDCDDLFCINCGKKQEMYSAEKDKPKPVRKTDLALVFIAFIVIIGIICVVFKVYSSDDKNNTTKTIDMGAIGNKITVDGTVAYVAGENKILVPYDFCGTFSECDSEAYNKSLKGCVNMHLPTDETDDLPEEVAREIISFYGDTGGFWTARAVTWIDDYHYAGMMGGIFKVGSDGVAHSEWGYCLDGIDDSTTMGLLVLYGVIIDEFEFTDVEDTADPNYSTEFPYESVMATDDEDEQNTSSQQAITYEDVVDEETCPALPVSEYTLTHIFNEETGWMKVVDSNGNYSDDWKLDEINRLKSFLPDDNPEYYEMEIKALEESLDSIQPNMYIDVSDEWMRCYNIHNDFDLCKPAIDEAKAYDASQASYGHRVSHRVNSSGIDSSMGNYYSFKGEVYKIDEDESANYVGFGYTFYYYPDVNGIGVGVGNYELLFTLQ